MSDNKENSHAQLTEPKISVTPYPKDRICESDLVNSH